MTTRRRAELWAGEGRDVFVYFHSDAKVHAPRDARRLRARLDAGSGIVQFDGRPVRAFAPALTWPSSR